MTMFLRQLLVVGSPQLAAISMGGAVCYPSVLLQQLASNDSSIHVDFDTATWMGSIHGFAGIPSVLMLTFMQWKGRKISYIVACLITILGWILAYTATNAVSILISESLHGLGTNSLIAVIMLAMSEMVAPQFRNVSIGFFHVANILGVVLGSIIGRYLHWKTVSIIMGAPLVVAMSLGFMWPESPSWLACKGKFEECEQAFTWLRGTDKLASKDLQEIITAQKENLSNAKQNRRSNLKCFWKTLTSKDFYIPSLHIFVLLYLIYWSGGLVILVYAIQIIENATNNADAAFFGAIIMNSIMFICVVLSAVLSRRFNNKSVLLLGTVCLTACLLTTSLISFLQTIDVLSKESLVGVYSLIAVKVASSLGVMPTSLTVTGELMPVKYRGIGGAFYVICICMLHSSSFKLFPYLLKYIHLWGTMLLFAGNVFICGLFVWKYVPETKGKTLQQLENYYMFGKFEYSIVRSDGCLARLSDS